MNEKWLNECYEPNDLDIPKSKPEPICSPNNTKENELENFFKDLKSQSQKTGLGKANQCDPQMAGRITNLDDGNRDVIYRYANTLRACDEAMLDLFNDLEIIDENGIVHKTPIIWGSQEKAVAAVFQENVRKDNSLVVDRIRLPILSIYSTDIQPQADRYTFHKAVDYLRRVRPDLKPGFTVQEKQERDTIFGVSRGVPVDVNYTLTGWVMFQEDKISLLQQIYPRVFPMATLKLKGVYHEVVVKVVSMGDNTEREPGDQATRVIKFDINMTAETYISQPIVRKKAVLSQRVDLVTGIDEEDIEQVVKTLRFSTRDL